MQAGAFLIILAGLALGIYLAKEIGEMSRLLYAHIVLGAIVGALVVLQVTAIVARPKPESKIRCCSLSAVTGH